MGHWCLDDIDWSVFEPAKVDPTVLQAVKAASLVEANSADYVTYLINVFADDPEVHGAIRQWGEEEMMHGRALAAWARHCDPAFDFDACLARFRAGYQLPLYAQASVRGSRSGEWLARCVVECGTSSYYSAIRDASAEPVLKEICHRIAGDEFRHYKLFFDNLQRYAPLERLSLFARVKVALGRVAETDDDELSFAYHCANYPPEQAYDRRHCMRAYSRRAYPLYRYGHLARAIAMMMKAIGLDPQSRLAAVTQRGAWWLWAKRVRWLERQAA